MKCRLVLILMLSVITLAVIFSSTVSADSLVERVYGETRYETAVRISQSGWNRSDHVLISRQDDFPDALSSTPLAYRLDAPVLLTPGEGLNPLTEQEINRLGARHAVFLGGEEALSTDLEEEVEAMGLSVDRYGGEDRYETAVKIAETLGGSDKAVVAAGTTFQDALVSAPYAAREEIPVLLTRQNEVPESTRAFLEEQEIEETLVVGSSESVSGVVLEELPEARRIAGTDFVGTSVAVASEFFPNSEHYYISRSDLFPDSLTGAVLAAKNEAPVLLTSTSKLEENPKLYLEERKPLINRVSLLGGEQALGARVKYQLENMVYHEPTEMHAEQIYESVAPSVVYLKVDNRVDGTGFVVDSEGVIATNYHLVEGGTEIEIELYDGTVYDAEKIVNYDRGTDLALIKIDAWNLPELPLDRSGDVTVGQEVFVIGNPGGMKYSMSDGIVSYENRYLEGWGEFIQMTAPVSTGSSGSPVLNKRGVVIGISNMTMPGEEIQNINFVTSSHKLVDLIDSPAVNIPLEEETEEEDENW